MTMTDAELAEIRARVDAAANHSRVDAEQQELLEYDIPALLDELAAAREVIAWYADYANWGYGSYDGSESYAYIEGDAEEDKGHRARAALHSATEDADDRTT